MRKYIKRIFLALALAGALAATAQPVSATTELIQRNEAANRLWQQWRAWVSVFFWPAGYLPEDLPLALGLLGVIVPGPDSVPVQHDDGHKNLDSLK